jgi:peptidoglycan/LPS O-acetylase OafA/YrhL
MISVVAAGFLIKQLAFVTASQSKDSTAIKYWNYFINFFYFTRIECMAVGAIGAWCVFKCQKGVLALAYHKVTQLAVYALLAYSLVTVSHKPVFNYTPYAILHCLVIINVATNPHSLLKLESGLFVFLGNISYSIYMFHEVAIQIAMNAIGRFHTTTFGDPASNAALYASSIIFSLALATVSYQFFELKFLRLKRTYSVILSGSDVKEEHARLVRR